MSAVDEMEGMCWAGAGCPPIKAEAAPAITRDSRPAVRLDRLTLLRAMPDDAPPRWRAREPDMDFLDNRVEWMERISPRLEPHGLQRLAGSDNIWEVENPPVKHTR